MGTNLNQYFLTFEVYQNENKIHSMECPRSMISEMIIKLKNLYPTYTVKIVDHEGKLRMESSMLNKLNIEFAFQPRSV